jgi:TRAP-type uncharacterized transport system fused permease subunit
MRTALQAIRLSVAGFLVPYLFVYSPIMLGVDFAWGPILVVATSATAGVIALAAAMEGYFLAPTTRLERLLLVATAIDLIVPGLLTDLLGAALFALVIVLQRRRARP